MPRLYEEPAYTQDISDADILTFSQNVDLGDDQFAMKVVTGSFGEFRAYLGTSFALTGNPTAPLQSVGNNSTRVANTQYVDRAIANLTGSAPGVLDTLAEIALALGSDADFADTITALVGGKMPLSYLDTDKTLGGLVPSDIKVPSQKAVYAAIKDRLGPGVKPVNDGTKAAAGTLDLTDVDGQVGLTGTGTVNSVTLAQGKEIVLKTVGVVTFTHSANLISPSSANIVTDANSIIVLRGGASGVVSIVGFIEGDGTVVHKYISPDDIIYPFQISGSEL